MTKQENPSQAQASVSSSLLRVVVFTLLYLALNGYQYGENQQLIHIPFILSSYDNELFRQDYLLTTKANFLSFYPSILTSILQLGIGLPDLMFVLHLATVFIFLRGVVRVVRSFPSTGTSELVALALVTIGPVAAMARAPFSFCLTTHTNIVFGLSLHVVAMQLRVREDASSWQRLRPFLLLGLLANIHALSAAHLLGFMLPAEYVRSKKPLDLILAPMLFVLGALPLVLWYLELPLQTYDETWLKQIRLRSSHHVFPSTWPSSEFTTAALWGFLGPMTCFFFSRIGLLTPRIRMLLAFYLVMFGYMLLGTLFAEIVPWPLVIRLQLFRASKFVFVISIILTSLAFLPKLKTPNRIKRDAFYAYLILCMLVLLPDWKFRVRTVLRQTSDYWQANPELVRAAEWTQGALPKDSHIIVPPYISGFRVNSLRSVFTEWHDGTQQFFNAGFSKEWYQRQKLAGETKEGYQSLSEDSLRQIARKYKLTHAVFEVPKSLPLKEVYRNTEYVIYSLEAFGTISSSSSGTATTSG